VELKYEKHRKSHRASDNPVEVVSPEDHAGGGVGGLVLDTEACPLSVVGARRHGGDEEGEHVHHGVDLAGDAHVEEHDGTDEHAQEANEEEMAHRVGVVIGKGHSRSVLVLLTPGKSHSCIPADPSAEAACTVAAASVHLCVGCWRPTSGRDHAPHLWIGETWALSRAGAAGRQQHVQDTGGCSDDPVAHDRPHFALG